MAGKKFSLEAIFSAVDKLSAPLAKMRTKLGAFGKSAKGALASANSAVDKGLAGISKFSNVLGIGAIASVAGIGLELKNVIEHGAEFEQTLIRAGTAFDVPVKKGTAGFKELSDAARNIGRTTEFSAQQAAEGINSLATAGFTAKQSIAALPRIIDFASAGSLDLGVAADIASNTLGAFGLRSKDAGKNAFNMGRAMDVMVRAAADSTTNVTELFEAMKTGGSSAAAAGASIEEFTGMAGVLANAGVKGSEAGTAIRNSFMKLTNPTAEATKTMTHLGIQIAKNKDGSLDMTTTIGRFAKATSKLTGIQKSAAIGNVFGALTQGAFLNLMNAGEGTIRDFTKNLEKATGVTKTMADTMRESTTNKIKKFWNALEDVRLGVFEAISGTVLEIAGSVGDWVTANQALINTKAAEWCTKLKDALPEIWTWIKRVTVALGAFLVLAAAVKAVTLLVTIIGGLSAAYTWLFISTTTAAGGTGALSIAFGFLTSATIGSRIATIASTVAQAASRVATLAMAAAQWALSAPLNATLLATIGSRIATVAMTVAQVASRLVTLLAAAAQAVYAAAISVTSGALGAFRVATLASVPAIAAQVAAMAPLLAVVLTATAAVAALVAVWDQYNKLDKELAGSGGITGTIGKMVDMGTFDPFKAHDAALNEKAQADARKREAPQVVTPGARAASEAAAAGAAGASGTVDGTITVKAEKGTKAQVKSQPNKVKLAVGQPSGAFP
jgi:TP901 family phage tail tape measure protein